MPPTTDDTATILTDALLLELAQPSPDESNIVPMASCVLKLPDASLAYSLSSPLLSQTAQGSVTFTPPLPLELPETLIPQTPPSTNVKQAGSPPPGDDGALCSDCVHGAS